MTVTLRPASPGDAGILERLMQLYMHDFSSFSDTRIDDEGQFNYPYLNHYWAEPDRFPFLVQASGRLAGFVLVRREQDPENLASYMSVAEFFILRGERRKSTGANAAALVWGEFPGPWRLRVMPGNTRGLAFWRSALASAGATDLVEEKEAETGTTCFRFIAGV